MAILQSFVSLFQMKNHPVAVIMACIIGLSSLAVSGQTIEKDVKITLIQQPDTVLNGVLRSTQLFPLEDSMKTHSLRFGGRIGIWVKQRPDAIRKMLSVLDQVTMDAGVNGFRFVSYSKDSASNGFHFVFDLYWMKDSLVRVNQSLKPANRVFIFNSRDTVQMEINHSTHYFYPGTWYSFDARPDETYRITPEYGRTLKLRPKDIKQGKNRYLYSQKKNGSGSDNRKIAAAAMGGLVGLLIYSAVSDKSGNNELKPVEEQRAYILSKIYRQIQESEIRIHPKMRQKQMEASGSK